MGGILLFGGLLTLGVLAYLTVFEFGFIVQGLVPLLRNARKHPTFGLRTLLSAMGVFALTFTLVRELGVFDRWQNTWIDYLFAFILCGICLVLSVGVACVVGLMFGEAAGLAIHSQPVPETPPDFHFLEERANANDSAEIVLAELVTSDEPHTSDNDQYEPLDQEGPMTYTRFDQAGIDLTSDPLSRASDSLGPWAADLAIRQALAACWKNLPPENRTFETITAEIRRLVDRALADYQEDCQAFAASQLVSASNSIDGCSTV